MSLSDSLASLNRERYRSFAAHSETTKPETGAFKQAALAFDGPAFRGLAFSSLDKDEVRHTACLCDSHAVTSTIYRAPGDLNAPLFTFILFFMFNTAGP